MLYSMYSQKEKPKINYPTLKGKKRLPPAQEIIVKNVSKPCPQQTMIEYPEMPRKNKYKFHAVDFIPRKVHEEQIMADLE